MVKISIAGVCGKMGSRILALASTDYGFDLGGIFEAAGHHQCGAEIVFKGTKFRIDCAADKSISNSDVLIDFTTPEATLTHLKTALKNKKPMVIGTTGFSESQVNEMNLAARTIPIVFFFFFLERENLLFKLAKETAKTLKDYDVEIVELHHNQKKDAPSGTAVKLAQIISETQIISEAPRKKNVYGREGITGARKKDELGVFAVRAGDIVGEHTLYFAGQGERIELTHRAHSRDCFARGALMAAKWIVSKEPRIYSMQDVLGI